MFCRDVTSGRLLISRNMLSTMKPKNQAFSTCTMTQKILKIQTVRKNLLYGSTVALNYTLFNCGPIRLHQTIVTMECDVFQKSFQLFHRTRPLLGGGACAIVVNRVGPSQPPFVQFGPGIGGIKLVLAEGWIFERICTHFDGQLFQDTRPSGHCTDLFSCGVFIYR